MAEQVTIECVLNRKDGSLPFAYQNPKTGGKLLWKCGYDQEGRITSVFYVDDPSVNKREVQYLENVDKAREFRDALINDGWKEVIPPETKVTYKDASGDVKELNREQRRALKKKVKKIQKENPFN